MIHYITRAKPWRPFALWLLYIGLLVVAVWIAVIIALVGLAERPLRLRERAFPFRTTTAAAGAGVSLNSTA